MCVKRTDNTTKREKIWVALLRNPYETKNRAHKILTEVEGAGGGEIMGIEEQWRGRKQGA